LIHRRVSRVDSNSTTDHGRDAIGRRSPWAAVPLILSLKKQDDRRPLFSRNNSGNARCYSAFFPLLFDNRESGRKRLKASHKSNPEIQHNSGKKL
jgi:hypothetical protein